MVRSRTSFSEASVCFWPSKSDADSRLLRQMWWGFVPFFLHKCLLLCDRSWSGCAEMPKWHVLPVPQHNVQWCWHWLFPHCAVLNSHDAYNSQIYLQTIWCIEKCLSTQINIIEVSGFYWRWKCMPCNVIGVHKRSWLLFPGNLCEDVWLLICFANDVLQRFANMIQG